MLLKEFYKKWLWVLITGFIKKQNQPMKNGSSEAPPVL